MAKGKQPAPEVPALQAKLVPIDSVKLDPSNAREHNDRSIATLVDTLKEFGQQKPLVVDRAGVIRAGNGTWMAAKRLGWKKINVIVTGLTGKAADLYAVADNRLGELSYFDDAALAKALTGVEAGELPAVGFDQAELVGIFEASQLEPEVVTGLTGKSQNMNGQVAVRMLVMVTNVGVVERAIAATGKANREQALLEVCQSYLNAAGQFDAG